MKGDIVDNLLQGISQCLVTVRLEMEHNDSKQRLACAVCGGPMLAQAHTSGGEVDSSVMNMMILAKKQTSSLSDTKISDETLAV